MLLHTSLPAASRPALLASPQPQAGPMGSDPTPPDPRFTDYVTVGAQRGAAEFGEIGRKLGTRITPDLFAIGSVALASVSAVGATHLPIGGGPQNLPVGAGLATFYLTALGGLSVAHAAGTCGGAVGAVLGKVVGATWGSIRGAANYLGGKPLEKTDNQPAPQQPPQKPEKPSFKTSTLARMALTIPASGLGVANAMVILSDTHPAAKGFALAGAAAVPLLTVGAFKLADYVTGIYHIATSSER